MTNIVQFAAFAAAAKSEKTSAPSFGKGALSEYRAAKLARRATRLAEVIEAPETLTETCRNQRLRLARRDIWWNAERETRYWRARLDWNTELGLAQQYHIGDASAFPPCDDCGASRDLLLNQWRTALVKQMLTPAPDARAIEWKRKQLRADQFKYVDVKPERLQRAIDADVEWLAAHPTRKAKGSTTPHPDPTDHENHQGQHN